ncbi:MAG TPA: ArsA-related P-loop ATPase [Candidatus Dormibacteraeota bacterium]|nr:ArsA-related P-loop ATPase [Candidatus Dormibacteraeota bacterium]
MIARADLVELLAGHRMIVCCGSGGVGKTTVSAALGMAIASARDTRVLVLTIDPARRLATALGLSAIGTRPVRVAPDRLRAAGLAPRGELAAAMLDAGSEWDRLVERHAGSPEVRDRILANRFYRGISTAFAGSQEYVALDAVYDFHAGGEYGCIVLDTPPSRSALDFLEAPDRLTDFVSARLLSWLAGPSRIGLVAARPFLRMADRLLGGEVLEELGAFVRDIQSLYEGVRRRAASMYDLLRSRSTAFAVVTTLDPQPFAEAEFLCARLRDRSMPLRAVVVNRVLPDALLDPSAVAAARTLAGDAGMAAWLAAELDEPVAPAVPRRLGQAFLSLHATAERHAAQAARLGRLGRVPVARLPLADRDVSDLESLGHLARWLRDGDR